jgi:glutamate-1-semialdehyde aminotransferase
MTSPPQAASRETADLERRLLARIPGGTQLLSKRPEQFAPQQWPRFYSRAKGVEVWDLDGRRFLDMSITGVGTCALGYADDDVNAAVHAAVERGSMSTLNCAEDLVLADLLIMLHPWAEMVRYARTGGEALSIAVRLRVPRVE